jgi:hypothetical protein
MSWTTGARAFAAACLFVCINSHAQTSQTQLVNVVSTVAAATQAVPLDEKLPALQPGTYQVTLTDLGAQLTPSAPLATAELGVTGGNAVVGTPAVLTSGSKTLSTTFTVSTAAEAGAYVIHVVGTPEIVAGSAGTPPGFPGTVVPGSGSIGLLVTNTSTNAQVAAFSGTLAFPSTGIPTNVATLNDTFSVTTAGSYTVTLTDMQFPQPLTTLTLAITLQGTLLTDPTFSTTSGNPVATVTLTLQAGTYQIFAGGQAGGAVNAGLYGVNVSLGGGGATVYSNTIPVGSVTSVGSPALTAASYTLTFSDLAFPSALSQAAAAVTLNGQSVAQLTATGTSSPFTATAVPYQVFALGLPASGGQGSYTLSVQPVGGTPVLNLARAVSDPTSGIFAYSFDSTATAQAYTLDLADFGYPAALTSIQAAAVQAGALLSGTNNGATATSLSASGSLAINPVAGPISLLVFAQPAPAASSGAATGGLFGIDLTETGAGAPAFQTSQGVGQLFSVQTATVTTGGSYQAVVTDLGFPANFANLAVIVTRGTSKIGSIFGGGTLQFNATGGDYLINFVAQPTGTFEAGTYSIVVEEAPPAATVTLQAAPASVSSGGTATLTWSSANTSSCTASSSPAGAWSGTVATSGTATSAALTATTTFTLTCVGTDGTSPSQTATVTVTSTTSSHNGGGAIGADVILLLVGALGLRLSGRRIPVARDRLC